MSDLLKGIIIGMVIGVALYILLDPPPEEVIEAIANSKWARKLAEQYVDISLPPEEREKIINEVARAIARHAAEKLFL